MAFSTQPRRISRALVGQVAPSHRKGKSGTNAKTERNSSIARRGAMWVSLLLIASVSMAVYGDSIFGGETGTVVAALGILGVVTLVVIISTVIVGMGHRLRGHRAYERVDLPRSWNR